MYIKKKERILEVLEVTAGSITAVYCVKKDEYNIAITEFR